MRDKLQVIGVILGMALSMLALLGWAKAAIRTDLEQDFVSHPALDKVYHDLRSEQEESAESIKNELLYLRTSMDGLRMYLMERK
jgi:hypothetical protein